ncbi:MAG: hypothetical protein KF678_12625 [Phycisphaeraceae bacterium]|nr:hypothetical protein [Phycisphaeraceae bacterium]
MVRFALLMGTAAVLLFAASAKLASVVALGTMTYWVVGQILVEAFLACWLVTGKREWLAVRVACLCFGVFLIAAIGMGVAGSSSCGCFGALKSNPWGTASLDLVVISGLAFLIAKERELQPSSRPGMVIRGVGGALLVTGAAGVFILTSPLRLDATGLAEARPGAVIFIDPTQWIGKRCPLLEHIGVSANLDHGEWKLVLFHHDCPDCQQVVEKYHDDSSRVAFLEIPPHGDRKESERAHGVWGKLDDGRNWFAETPMVIELRDGVVTGVQDRRRLRAAGLFASNDVTNRPPRR